MAIKTRVSLPSQFHNDKNVFTLPRPAWGLTNPQSEDKIMAAEIR